MNFKEREDKMVEKLEIPLNILEAGKWRSQVIEGVRQRVWLHSEEEILLILYFYTRSLPACLILLFQFLPCLSNVIILA